jgi:hypothetical protein
VLRREEGRAVESNVALVALFTNEFAWCHVTTRESVAIVTEPAFPPSYVAASVASLTGWVFRRGVLMTPTADKLVERVCRGRRHAAIPSTHQDTFRFSGT